MSEADLFKLKCNLLDHKLLDELYSKTNKKYSGDLNKRIGTRFICWLVMLFSVGFMTLFICKYKNGGIIMLVIAIFALLLVSSCYLIIGEEKCQ